MQPSTVFARAPGSSGWLRQEMQRHPLFFYFLMAYTFSSIILIPYVLSVWGYLPGFFVLATYLNTFLGPTLAAYIMINVTEGKDGVRRWLRRFRMWRFSWQWYAFILLGIPALVLFGILVLPGARESFAAPQPSFALLYAANFVLILVLGGPLGEEPGWRGFALPRLLPRYGPLWSSVVLGVLWGLWHLPFFLTPAQHGGPGTRWSDFFMNLPIFVASTVAMTIIFTWVFNHTRTSIFAAILLHAAIDTTSTLTRVFPASIVNTTDLEILIPFGITALLLVVVTRGRLGYQPNDLVPLQDGGSGRIAVRTGQLMAGLLALSLVGLVPPSAPRALADPAQDLDVAATDVVTFTYTGSEQQVTVPPGTGRVEVTVVGGAGGRVGVDLSDPPIPGGRGARVSGVLTNVVAGQTLYVEVGGPGGSDRESFGAGGFNGGGSGSGGGGGASDVRTAPRAVDRLETRLIVAGGGGGAGAQLVTCDGNVAGTRGGDAGSAGASSTCPGTGTSFGGDPGGSSAGGAGGKPGGQPGQLGQGASSKSTSDNAAGGGGGGGLYGGGSGGLNIQGSNPLSLTASGGGGGGSSLVPGRGTFELTNDQPSVTFKFTPVFYPLAEFAYTGGEQTITVPLGTTTARVTAVGAAGSRGSNNPAPGGRGAHVSGTLTDLVSGQRLYVEVGGSPMPESGEAFGSDGGFNGGGSTKNYDGTPSGAGGGGGASDVRTSPRSAAESLNTRLIVAGGGGGAGMALAADQCNLRAALGDVQAAGGDAGNAGGSGVCDGNSGLANNGGGAGEQSSGGRGGNPDGAPGSLGQGGDSHGNGGGGGGGLFGGGGGGAVSTDFKALGGGGGGGASLAPSGGGTQDLTSDPASVTIRFIPELSGSTAPASPNQPKASRSALQNVMAVNLAVPGMQPFADMAPEVDAPASTSATFTYTGGEQQVTVPPGTTRVEAIAIGAPGAAPAGNDGPPAGRRNAQCGVVDKRKR